MWANENKWNAEVESASARFGVPSALVRAIIGAESAYVPSALRREVKINDASAGLMQILLGTARGEGYSGEMGDPAQLTGLFNPGTNIYYGTSFLSAMYRRTSGNIPATISAYNGGYRPELGFGAPAPKALTLCLARDATGKCISTRNVQQGEYGNQPYVNKVLGYYEYFKLRPIVNTVPPTYSGPPITTSPPRVSPPLGNAHRDTELESSIGERDCRTPARLSWPQVWATVRYVIREWWRRRAKR